MEEIREAALAYYAAGTDVQKQLAREFFDAMDVDGDERVNRDEFINFLTERGYGLYNHPSLFQQLNSSGNGGLDFNEVLTLYYIIKSRRPFCVGCKVFLKGLFFTCLDCHGNGSKTFDLCSACFGQKKYRHEHATILDNYTLLAHKRLTMAMGEPEMSRASSGNSYTTTEENLERKTSSGKRSFFKSRSRKVMERFVALEAAFTIGGTCVAVAAAAAAAATAAAPGPAATATAAACAGAAACSIM